MKATITFPNRELAKQFVRAWTAYTFKGCDMSRTLSSGEVAVDVYGVTDHLMKWIENEVKTIQKEA